ncbi:MAG: hypothetical protein K2I20_01920 [Clostridia bacterium]|nr:hypothetical protein [Clostridia bacterium]
MHGKKIYILFALLGMAVLIICLVVGALNKLDWLILTGFGVCAADFIIIGIIYGVRFIRELNAELKENSTKERSPENEEELLEKINNAPNGEESLKAQSVYYAEGAENAGELIASAFGFSKEGKKAFKKASFGDKAKVIAFFAWLGITLLTFGVGITLSNLRVQPAGFITMGAGGGLFFLTIIAALIFNLAERRAYFGSTRAKRKIAASHGAKIRTGVVKRCEIHSQHKAGNRTPQISGTLYQIWVWTSDKEPLVRLVCSKRYQKYDKVRFYEGRGLGKRRIIEE